MVFHCIDRPRANTQCACLLVISRSSPVNLVSCLPYATHVLSACAHGCACMIHACRTLCNLPLTLSALRSQLCLYKRVVACACFGCCRLFRTFAHVLVRRTSYHQADLRSCQACLWPPRVCIWPQRKAWSPCGCTLLLERLCKMLRKRGHIQRVSSCRVDV